MGSAMHFIWFSKRFDQNRFLTITIIKKTLISQDKANREIKLDSCVCVNSDHQPLTPY